jgi:hypothetical protein
MRGGRVIAVLGCAVAVFEAAACSNGVRADTGDDAFMRIAGAQFFRGPMPEGSSAGPSVAQLSLINNNIWAGLADDPLSGSLSPTATAAAIGLARDVGYWIVPAGVPSVATPGDPSFSATAEFSQGIILGSYTLVVRAVDTQGTFGPPASQILVAESSPTDAPATGDLVVTLTWDTESNLDLHVIDPSGVEIYWDNQSSQPPFSFDQSDGGSYGYVDYDSNANCVIDGLRREDAIWSNPPPSGDYIVRVDAASLCGENMANWNVRVVVDGTAIAQAAGVALDADTIGSHGTGAGVTALRFSIP